MREVLRRYGRLDALINNAGLANPATGPLEKLALAEWNRRIGVNLTGVFLMTKHAAPHLRLARRGRVRVNCVSPGWIDVSGEWKKRSARKPLKLRRAERAQHPVGRVGRPQDVAELAAYLICDAAAFITGQNFVIDGGMTKKMIYV